MPERMPCSVTDDGRTFEEMSFEEPSEADWDDLRQQEIDDKIAPKRSTADEEKV